MTMSMSEHDPMTMSMMQPNPISNAKNDPMTMSMTQPDPIPTTKKVDPMTMSMSQNDPMSMSMSQHDPMTASVFGDLPSQVPVAGSDKPEPKKVVSPTTGPRAIPGTNMRCLDDPSFMFDDSSNAKKVEPAPKPSNMKVLEAPEEVMSMKPKMGGYRVLEAPDSSPSPYMATDQPKTNVTENPVSTDSTPYKVLDAPMTEAPKAPAGKGSPYRVLEAPDLPPSQPGKAPALVSPTSGRSVTDALDKARSRFDSFWGGNKEKDSPSNV